MEEEAEGSWELVRKTVRVLWQRCVDSSPKSGNTEEEGVGAGGSMDVNFAEDIRVTFASVTDGKAEEERLEVLRNELWRTDIDAVSTT